MTVKELAAKYPKHLIIAQGKRNSIPFTQLPPQLRGLYGKQYSKVLNGCEVRGYKVNNTPTKSVDITHIITGGKPNKPEQYEGTLTIFLLDD